MYFAKFVTAQHPCESVKCGAREHCSLDERGVAECGCGPACELAVRPVCGSDGRTYDSRCHLDRASCLDNRDVRVAYTGPCGELNFLKRKIVLVNVRHNLANICG